MTRQNELSVEITARLDKLEKSLQQATRSANDNFRRMEARGEQAAQKLDRSFVETSANIAASLATVGGAAVTVWREFDRIESAAQKTGSALSTVAKLFVTYRVAIGTFAAVSAAAIKAHATIEQLQQIATSSEAAGVGSTFWQGFVREAEAAKIATDKAQAALVAAKGALSDRADARGKVEQNGVGALLDEIYRGGFKGRGLGDFLGAQNLEGRIEAIKRALRELMDAGRELQAQKLGELAFGAGGEEIIRGLKNGLISVGDSARQAGAVFDEALVKRADELDASLRKARAELADAMLPVSRDLASVGLEIAGAWNGVQAAILGAVAAVGRLYDASKSAFAQIAAANAEIARGRRASIRDQIAERGPDAIITDEDRTRKTLNRALAQGQKQTVDANFLDASTAFLPAGQPQPKSAPLPPNRPPISAFSEPPAPAPRGGGGGGSPTQSPDEVERYLARLQKSLDVLQAEASAIGKSNVERERLVKLAEAEAAARQRGTPLTDAERAKVEQLATATGKLNDQMEKTRRARDGQREAVGFVGNSIVDALDSAILKGERLQDVLKNLVAAFARAALQAALLGSGPFGNLFGMGGVGGAPGGLIGAVVGGFAEGGMIRGPGTGKSDSILAAVSNGEFVMNAEATARHLPLLNALNKGGLPHFAAGGLVGAAPSLSAPVVSSAQGAQNIQINAPVTVQTQGGGTPEQNADLAAQMARQMEKSMRQVVVAELVQQLRFGNLLNRH